MSGFKVVKSGFLTQLQDRGRFGFEHLGVTNSGVMDEYAYNWVNRLLDNKKGTNVLEIAFASVKLESTVETTIAVAGADMDFCINGVAAPNWQTHHIYKGDILEFKKLIKGQRAYLGVKDGFLIEKEHGSNSTTIKESLGGIKGQKIKEGDFLPYHEEKSKISRRVKKEMIPRYEDELSLRVVLGYQDELFDKKQKEKFFNSYYSVTSGFDAMGCKLKGEEVKPKKKGIISEGICFGSIQIPSDGQPIILLKQRQTIGGYPKIGSVLDIDCFRLAQMREGSKIRFKEISLEEAQKKRIEFLRLFS